jgi:hypothetical protein
MGEILGTQSARLREGKTRSRRKVRRAWLQAARGPAPSWGGSGGPRCAGNRPETPDSESCARAARASERQRRRSPGAGDICGAAGGEGSLASPPGTHVGSIGHARSGGAIGATSIGEKSAVDDAGLGAAPLNQVVRRALFCIRRVWVGGRPGPVRGRTTAPKPLHRPFAKRTLIAHFAWASKRVRRIGAHEYARERTHSRLSKANLHRNAGSVGEVSPLHGPYPRNNLAEGAGTSVRRAPCESGG